MMRSRLPRVGMLEGAGAARQLFTIVVTAAVGLILVLGTVKTWEYTNSPQFCGTTCHTMPPEYSAYQRSPHARVDCVECHLGRDSFTVVFGRKAGDMKHVLKLATQSYEVPIYAQNMRAARDGCERCHWPEKFSGDRIHIFPEFGLDEGNTQQNTYLVTHIGGGTSREGQGYGIHWHIEKQVWYIATDELKQEIPWVRVVDVDGRVKDYVDPTAGLTVEQIQAGEKRKMDCIDCHNRASHQFLEPDQAMNRLLSLNQIDRTIPAIKRNGIAVMAAPYASLDEALAGIATLESLYSEQYPDFYAENRASMSRTVRALQAMYQQIVFPDMKISWGTHPDNLGHDRSPGCFRCHDGNHVAADGTTIRLSCNICHTIPVTVQQEEPVPRLSLGWPGEPPSHLAANWMAQHRFVANGNCTTCHGKHTFGTDNANFCSNSNCHARAWEYVGLDAAFEHSVVLDGQHALLTCNRCHEEATRPTNTCSNCHEPPHAFGQGQCEDCHAPTGWKQSVAALVSGAVAVPHQLEGLENCLLCHGETGVRPAPDNHQGRTVASCLVCHQVAGNP